MTSGSTAESLECLRPFRVYVIVPQVLLAKAICSVFADDDDLDIVGDNPTFERDEFIAADPDLALLDCDTDLTCLPDMIEQCKAAMPKVRVCVLSTQLNAEVMLRAISAGADGYVVKDTTPTDLLASLKRVLHEGFYADPRLSRVLLRHRSAQDIVQLSARERDVTRLVAQGLSNKEISQRLSLSDKTVKNHISNIFSKLQVTARTQVAIYAIRNGIA